MDLSKNFKDLNKTMSEQIKQMGEERLKLEDQNLMVTAERNEIEFQKQVAK